MDLCKCLFVIIQTTGQEDFFFPQGATFRASFAVGALSKCSCTQQQGWLLPDTLFYLLLLVSMFRFLWSDLGMPPISATLMNGNSFLALEQFFNLIFG